MSWFSLAVFVLALPILAQSPMHSKHPDSAVEAADNKLLDQVDALQNRARQISKVELSRPPDPKCDISRLSDADFNDCFAADQKVTESNYRAFARALQASLAIQLSNVDPKIFPPPSKNFAAGEQAWRAYLGRTCAALGDTFEGGTASTAAMSGCRQDLTRRHIQDLSKLFLQKDR